jgi:hypothetical protein
VILPPAQGPEDTFIHLLPDSFIHSFKKYGEGQGEVAQTMYTHVSKCKNDKIKKIYGKNKLKFCTNSGKQKRLSNQQESVV